MSTCTHNCAIKYHINDPQYSNPLLIITEVDDEIQSAPDLGRLAYTLPSIGDTLGGVPIEVFNTHYIANENENIIFELKTSNQAEATNSACPDEWKDKCYIYYSLRYTPLLHDVTPSNVYWD